MFLGQGAKSCEPLTEKIKKPRATGQKKEARQTARPGRAKKIGPAVCLPGLVVMIILTLFIVFLLYFFGCK